MMALLKIAICVTMVILSKSEMSKQWFREWIRETDILLCAFISIYFFANSRFGTPDNGAV